MTRTVQFVKVFEYEVEVDDDATFDEILGAGEDLFVAEMESVGLSTEYDDATVFYDNEDYTLSDGSYLDADSKKSAE